MPGTDTLTSAATTGAPSVAPHTQATDALPPGRGLPGWWSFIEDRILLNVATILMMAAIGFMFYEASSRSLLSESHWWAEELVRFLVVWSVLLSLGVGTRHGHYIRMDLLLNMMPHRVRLAFAWLNSLIGLAFSVLLVIAGFQEVAHLQAIGMFTESNLDLPLWTVRLVLPLGGVLYGFAFIGNIILLLRGHDPDPPVEGENL
ncbi:TRAP transporter small permease [Azospirillum brasilense]|uniref:TRAP transporter small permease protein n=1 Tax=Azospirillum brasilense TaxID=192 RepID=A0A4D8QVQ8_AZOBR|nr:MULTISPECIES: TRAP transporter small permease [Azospirillum]MDW7556922.1 TRAP transporter small permease [Azospirillum brasilense]MDW7596691.1 TRAP transporter small permease [Azospirillum brasilense]MDW7631572.1 TRAP transporter small permease [Azospirillum brasilense]MDX5950313.1 TRAP transporter small permease [Azospirillum brasilense]NUB15506.1 TRAP transporter small permease subunit [Azospirillum brasilense]